MTLPALRAVRGEILHFLADPAHDARALEHFADGLLILRDGHVAKCGPASALLPRLPADAAVIDYRGKLILPGFIDTHVHYPQTDIIASHGEQLLDWLEKYAFPAEHRFADPGHAAEVAGFFCDELLRNGTTTAAAFATVHAGSVDALFAAAQHRRMRLITGKVLMDRNCPDFLRDTAGEADSKALIERWHSRDRLLYAVTPRFAPTSSPAQLAMAGRLLARVPGLYQQTHVAENPQEVRWVAELFPQARSYLDVYAQHGLVHERSVFAHGIWLDDADRRLLHERGAQIAFCPSSNLFLGSGLFDWAAAQQAGVAVSLASDVGGGTSLSMRRTMLDAYKVQAMAGRRVSAFALLHAATRGAAQALRLGGEIGTLEPGCMADLTVWALASDELGQRRQAVARGLHERLFAWLTLGDEADLVETWVAGQRAWPC